LSESANHGLLLRLKNTEFPMGVGAFLRWVGMPVSVGWYSLLWRGWLKLFKATPKWVGALLRWVGMLVCVNWYALLWRGWLYP